jgi:sugar/nucleoside kinase (ribokinase family)
MPKEQKIKSPSLVSMGLVALDVVIGPERNHVPQLWAGGTSGNVTAILSYFGWTAFPLARLGKDFAARFVLEDLKKWNVRSDYVLQDPSVQTPVVIERIKKGKNGHPQHRFSFTCPSCGAWLPSYRSMRLNSLQKPLENVRADVFFFDRVSPASIQAASKFASEGSILFFEPSGVGDPRLFKKAIEVAHVIKYSHQRVREMAELPSRPNPLLEIETLGDEGLRYKARSGNRMSRWKTLLSLPAPSIKDTAGAGDWCSAGIISMLGATGLKDFENVSAAQLEAGLRYGQALAAWACGFEGPRGGMYETSKGELQKTVQGILEGNTPEAPRHPSLSRANETVRFVCLECDSRVKPSSRTGKSRRQTPAKNNLHSAAS